MINHSLLLTCQAPPRTPSEFTHGVYQRFGALLRATADISKKVSLLAVYRTDPVSVKITAEELEAYYQDFYGVSVKVTTVIIPPADRPPGRLNNVKHGLLDPLNFGTTERVRAMESLDRARRLLLSKPDLILVHKLSGFVTLTQLGSVSCRIALDLDDMEHKAALRLLRFPPHYPGKLLEISRPIGLAWLEHVASRQSAVTFICSEQDKRWMERFIRVRHVMVLPNAVDARQEVTAVPHSQNILFVGTLNYIPNSDAVSWFIREIWPQVLLSCPKATITIAGRCPERVPGYATAHPSISFLGFVTDLDPLYEKAQLVVCPIRAGGGTRIKIIEAAMYGRPVISTPLGAEGLDFQNPDELRIKKDPAGFSNECVQLLEDISACRSIGAKAHVRALRQYSRDAFISKTRAVLQNIVSN